jgi:hypothetical protein
MTAVHILTILPVPNLALRASDTDWLRAEVEPESRTRPPPSRCLFPSFIGSLAWILRKRGATPGPTVPQGNTAEGGGATWG